MNRVFILSIHFLILISLSSCTNGNAAESIADETTSDNAKKAPVKPSENLIFKELRLAKVIQSKVMKPKDSLSIFEPAINSPKSVIYSKDGSKFYINSLEGGVTAVFDTKTFRKLKEIRHDFNAGNYSLFKNNENTVFDYKFKQVKKEYNYFSGKPVESCLSHDGKYLWVTYYRRNFDAKAESPSAVAIIDTEQDQIVRVMPSGPLPKMIACSNDNKFIAVTHWGDNTVGLIDISSSDPMEFTYVSHIVVDKRLSLNFSQSDNRDQNCGNCLRGTTFTPDNKNILIAKMGGNGIAIIDVNARKYVGTITGSYQNLRHLVINQDQLILSSNKFGYVQKAKINDILTAGPNQQNQIEFKDWQTVKVGTGARTIDVTKDGKIIFACVNNESKVAVIDAESMKVISELRVASFPVGMSLSPDDKQLIITSQGKSGVLNSGNTVTVFDVVYSKK